MNTFKTLFKTELKLSLRGMDMIIFSIMLPLVILFLIGIIFGDKPAYAGAGYTFLEQSFGGIVSIGICAGGVMGLPLVVSDYRSKGILKRFKVTPIKPMAILFVQVSLYALYAFVSLVTVYTTASLFFNLSFKGHIGAFLMGWLLVMVSMFAIGLMVGGLSKNTKVAGIVASLLYFPMLIFSGATLPYEVMPPSMQKIADLLPLTQGIKLLKATTLGLPVTHLTTPFVVLLSMAVICTLIALKGFKWE